MHGSGGAAQGAMQTSLQNQGVAASNISSGVGQLNSQATQFNAPLAGTSSTLSGGINALSPGFQSGLGTALSSGGNLSAQTGVNQNQLGQGLVNYSTNTGGTNLAAAAPGLNSFYQGEMQNGIGQPAMLNAQDQLQQQFKQSMNTINNSAAPGQNTNAFKQQAQDNLLTSSGNLAGTLAANNQQVQQQGATGLASTASNRDAQVMSMLQQAFSTGQGLNTQTLQNLASVLGLGTTTLNQGLNSAQQGSSDIGAGISANQGLFSGYGGEAQQFGQQAQQNAQSGGLGGLLGSVSGLFSPIKIK